MKASVKYAVFWSVGLFLLNAFIVPLIAGNESINAVTIAGKAVIWGAAGVALYFIKEKNLKNNKQQ